MQLLTYIHDPDNLYIPLLENLVVPKDIGDITIAISPTTTVEVKNSLNKFKFKQIEGGSYGTARLNLLKDGLTNSTETHLFLCDFDKVIHWIGTNTKELCHLLNKTPIMDLTIIGRSQKALASYPQTWISTEMIATNILAKIVKQRLDFMNGPCILSRAAAEVLANYATESGIGSCVEFCLVVHAHGLSISSVEVDGLTWEDPDRYENLILRSKSYEEWKYDTYDSLYEWRKRVKFLDTQVEVMLRHANEPTNPKYPVVHNKTLEIS